MKRKLFISILALALMPMVNAQAHTKKFTSAPTTLTIGQATFSSFGEGYSNVITTKSGANKDAFAFKFKLIGGSTEVEAFCIQPTEPFNATQGIKFVPWKPGSDILVLNNYYKAADIAKNHKIIGNPLVDTTNNSNVNGFENVATQLAIWKLIDPDYIDINKIATSDVKLQLISRINALLDGAKIDREKIADSTTTISTKMSGNSLAVTIKNENPSKIASIPLSISYSDGSSALAITNSAGVAKFTKLIKGKATITGSVKIGATSIYTAPRSQAVIFSNDDTVKFTSKVVIK